jgi:hypothetical protein
MGIPSYLKASCVRITPEDPPKRHQPVVIRQKGVRVFVKPPRLIRRGEALKRPSALCRKHRPTWLRPHSFIFTSTSTFTFISDQLSVLRPAVITIDTAQIVVSVGELTSIMADTNEQRAVATAFAPPPPLWKHFSRDNLDKLDQIKIEASKDKDGKPAVGKKWSPAELRALDVPSELRFLVPPEVPAGEYTVFGEHQTVCLNHEPFSSMTEVY